MNDLKGKCRRLLQAKRASLPQPRRKEASEAAFEFLSTLSICKSYVLSFASFHTEIDLWSLNLKLAEEERLVLPKVEGAFLYLYSVKSLQHLQSNRWGILEPDPLCCTAVDPADIGLVLVPGLGFNPTNNHRLGYGKGFYDRLLPTFSPKTECIGVGFREQRLDKLPFDLWDIPLSSHCLF